MHGAVRGADDVHRRARPPGLRPLRAQLAAHRDHGRRAVPGRGDAPGDRPDAHARGDDLLRHDRDLAGLDPDRRRATTSSTGPGPSAASRRTSRSGSPTRRRPDAARAASTGEFQTRGYSVMLGYWEDPERTAEAIDAARWMHTGDLAVMDRGRLRADRRPDQGHDHPGRRERLSAGDRGVPLRPRRTSPTCRWSACPTSATARRSPRSSSSARAPRSTARRCASTAAGKIAHYKVPRHVIVCETFPLTVTGKVQKFKLREQAIEQLGLQRAAARADRLTARQERAAPAGRTPAQSYTRVAPAASADPAPPPPPHRPHEPTRTTAPPQAQPRIPDPPGAADGARVVLVCGARRSASPASPAGS